VQYCYYFLSQCSGAVMFTDLSFYKSLTSSFGGVEILTMLLFQQKICMHSLCFVAKLLRLHCREEGGLELVLYNLGVGVWNSVI